MLPRLIPMSDDWWFQDKGERVVWSGRPRLSAALPDVAVGSVICLLAVGAAVVVDVRILVGILPGLGILAWGLLRVQRTQFLLTTRAVWAKRGVLGRTVRRVQVDKIQNTSFSQSVSGSLFGYGTVSIEVAGGRDLQFSRVDDPQTVQTKLAERTNRGTHSIPGSREHWESVLDLVRDIRTTVTHSNESSD